MKILIIKTFPQEIGTNHFTYNEQELGLAVAFRKRGHVADVLCCSNDEVDKEYIVEQDGVKLIVYARHAFRVLKNGWPRSVDELLRRYDVLQAGEYNQMFSWYLSKKFRNKTVIYHGPYFCDYNRNYNRMAKLFDALFLKRYIKLNTPFLTKSKLAEQYLRNKGINNVRTVGVGLNTTLLQGNEEPIKLESIKQLDEFHGVKLLYIGRLEDRRNAIFMLDVLAEVLLKKHDAKLVIIGKFSDNAYRSRFIEHMESCSLGNNVIHIEQIEQSQLCSIYPLFDAFLFPTRYDIYGMVLLEAMFFGLPVISTFNGGADMMIHDGENGFVLDEFDAKKWADKVLTIFGDYNYKQKMGLGATTMVRQFFTWDILADRFLNCYKLMLFGSND